MLTGLIPVSSGDAIMPNNYSIAHNMHMVRSYLGVCPQHDVLFPELTVYQHLQLFAIIKGAKGRGKTNRDVHDIVMGMINEVGLKEKTHVRSSNLSGINIFNSWWH